MGSVGFKKHIILGRINSGEDNGRISGGKEWEYIWSKHIMGTYEIFRHKNNKMTENMYAYIGW